MDSPAKCPSIESLKLLLDGMLPKPDELAVTAHLESCGGCQSALESLAAGKESWLGAAQRLAQPATGVDAELAAAIRSAKGEVPGVTLGDADNSAAPRLSFLKSSTEPNSLGRLGTYEVMQVVGRGGFGIVLKALDTSLRRVVAIKVLSPQLASSSTARRRFVREARAAAAVSHDHVVAIHAVEESHDPPYFVMQFVEGKTLQERLDARGPLTVTELLRIGMQTADGLAAAHAQGLVHRDIKPANILLENGVERVKITDFGLARAVDDASLTQSGVVAGTPQFMSPEQARGDVVDARADLFSLGSVLYAMCTGRPPFRASTTMGVLKRVCEETPRPIREVNPDIPDWLEVFVYKLQAKNPADRFQSAIEVHRLLGEHLAHLQQPAVYPRPQAAATHRGTHDSNVVTPQFATAGKRPSESASSPIPAVAASSAAAMPRVGLLDRMVRFALMLMAAGGLTQIVILLFLFTRGLAVHWAIGGVVLGFALLVVALLGHLLQSWMRRRANSAGTGQDYAPQTRIRRVPLVAWIGTPVVLAAFAYGVLRFFRASDTASRAIGQTQRPVATTAMNPSTTDPSERSAAVVRELKELVAEYEQDLVRVQEQYARGVTAAGEVLTAQRATLEAKIRLAEAEGNRDEAMRLNEEIVTLFEKSVEVTEKLVKAGAATAAELSNARKELSEARIRLESARERAAGVLPY